MMNQDNGLRTILGLVVIGVGTLWIAVSALSGGGIHHFLGLDDKGPHVIGSGKLVTASRPLDGVTTIDLKSNFDATITIGPEPSITLTTDDNVLPLIKTETDDETLTISLPGRVSTKTPPRLAITVPSLDELTLNASKVSVAGLSGGSLTLTISGAGEVTASGTVEKAELEVDGAGRLHLDQLNTGHLDLAVNGAGKADVRATDSLSVEINGAGEVIYSGSPKSVHREINGVGTIRAAT